MSEFLAEARILVRPDTSRFRADLETQLKSVVARPIQIPVVPIVGAAFATSIAGTAALTAAQQAAASATVITSDALATATTISRQYAGAVDLSAVATTALAAAQNADAAAATKMAAANAAASRSQAGFVRGAAASGLTLFGLRGATLAASGAFLAGTAAIVGFSRAIKSAAELETELNVFKVTAGATADEMNRVSDASKQLGRDITLPGVTAQSAATAMTELAKAGLSVQDSLAGARGALQLSTAAQIDVAQATELVAGSLNAFGLAGDDAIKVADLLTGAAKESQGEITDMGTALSQAAAVSNQFGVSIEDTVTLLTELAQAGIAGGRAGTSLRVAFLRLVNPPAEAAKALKALNVQIRDAQGNLRPQIFTDIAKALQGYSKAQRDATLATIFGADAIRAAGIIGNKGADAFERTRDSVTEAGLAQELAGARTAGFEGDVENLANQIGALGLTVGQVAKGPVGLLVRTLGAATGAINETTDAAEKTGVFETFGQAIGDFATSFSRLGVAFNRGVIASTQTSKEFTALDQVAKGLKDTFDDLTQSLEDTASVLRVQLPADAGLGVKQLQNVVVGFDAQGVRARIAEDNAQLLNVLNEEQNFLERQLNRQFVKNRPALQRALEQALLGTVNDINVIQNKAKVEQDRLKREREQAAKDLINEQEDRAKALLNLRNSSLNLAIQQAGLTEGKADDRRAINKAIKVFQDDIAAIVKIKNLTIEQKQKVVDLKSAIAGLRASLKGLKDSSKGGGFSAADLFKEAVSNFTAFGSNITGRTGVLSGQDARAAFGKDILTQLGSAQLTESQKQTALLESIDQKIAGGGISAPQRTKLENQRYGVIQGLRGAAMAAAYGYGVN